MPPMHPPHLSPDDTWGMITAGTIRHQRLLAGDDVKFLVRDTLKVLAQRFNARLLA